MNDLALLRFNERGALSSLLAIEEHLQKAAPGSSAWCCRKHALTCIDHHLAEAVNHAGRIDPRKAEELRRLRLQAELVLHPNRPNAPIHVGDVARLRNQARAVFGDPTMSSSCGVCAKDGLAGFGWNYDSGLTGVLTFVAIGLGLDYLIRLWRER
jgi:hypothetical protein